MSIFDTLSRPKWRHKNPDIRKKAIAELDDQDLLLEVVKVDTDIEVQAAALARITDPNILDIIIDSLGDSLPEANQQQARSQRLKQLLPEQRSTNSEQLANMSDDTTLIRIASLSNDTQLISAAIMQIEDEEFLKDVASNHALAKVRLQAAQGISNTTTLKALMTATKGRDKAIYRHCKTLLEQHHADQQLKAEQQRQIQKLAQAARQLTQAADSPEYKGRYHLLEQQWSTLGAFASFVQQEQFQQDLLVCAKRLASIAEAQASDTHRQLEQAEASQAFHTLLAELEALNQASVLPVNCHDISQLSTRLDDIDSRWQASSEICAPPGELTNTFRTHIKAWRSILNTLKTLTDKKSRLERVLGEAQNVDHSDYQSLQRQIELVQKLLSILPWPESHRASVPSQLNQLKQALSQLNTHLDNLNKNQEQHRKQADTALNNMRMALDNKRSKDASRAHNKVKQALKSLPHKIQQDVDEQLRPLSLQLSEIRDWQDFALEPKKVDLCASMKSLIGVADDAETLAAKIQTLQDEWKSLGVLPHGSREQELWKAFKAAADKAWLPCKAAFTEQAKVRQANFENRMALVNQLKNYESQMAWPGPDTTAESEQTASGETIPGAKPDWPLVQQTLDSAREAFKNIQPVDRDGERKSQKAFRTICDKIYQHIKDEYQRNILLKEQVVEKAKALLNLEELQDAIDQAKHLQRDWKAIGMTPMKVDRKLWKAFREACDSVFARLDEQRDQRKAEVDEQVTQAETLLAQAHTLLNSDDDDQRLRLKKDLAELSQQFYNIELPDKVRQRLSKDFNDLGNKAEVVIKQIRAKREQANWDYLSEKIRACTLKNTDPDTANELWQQQGELPKGIDKKSLEIFWQQGPSSDSDEQLREACIALEIFGELESPAEDKTARMNYQMQRLVKGAGKQTGQATQTLQSNINDFIGLRPASDWAQRFCLNLEKIRI
ncbi:MAG: DUF349 domain-containing protein [Porticoccaceae bacterium]|nr:DUF349 domain-containing protein [Porticoccaceae bacterium]